MRAYITIFCIFFALLVSQANLFAQGNTQQYKTDALKQMQSGKYGEAIELLNKFISANPRDASGYHNRGLCYEQRGQLEYAVYDLRLARKLAPNDKAINTDLNRMTQVWHAQLKKKILGHEREIAINPAKGVNYLEIGKSYKNLGEWALAEQWYDKFLAREEPSPDEVIRYCEILKKTGSLVKGETILKKFTTKHPSDHRLWCEYGYFTMWLGKNQVAIDAFEKALALRPYFKEAQDGLNMARGKPYLHTYHDTMEARNRNQGNVQPEYPIDRYYRILRSNPGDSDTRFTLVQELLKENRLEEAWEQLRILELKHSEEERFIELNDKVQKQRETIYTERINKSMSSLAGNPDDKKALLEIGKYYAYLSQYDEALSMYRDYFERNPEETDKDLRYEYAFLSAQVKDYYTSVEYLDPLVQEYPDEYEYILLRGLINVWLNQDYEQARELLEKARAIKSDKPEPLIGLTALSTNENKFPEADTLLVRIKEMAPNHPELPTLESNLELRKLRYEEEQLFASLERGRDLFREGDCLGAIQVYDDFLAKKEFTPTIKKEYADLNVCAGNYDKALSLYDELILESYDPLYELERAKVFYTMGQYDSAVAGFERLVAEGNADFAANLFLGDAYVGLGEYSKATDKYDSMLETLTDSSEIAMVEMRKGWVPRTGLAGFLSSFPSYMLLSPIFSIYSDNLGFDYMLYGGSVEMGVLDFLSVGGSLFRGRISSDNTEINYNTLKMNVFLNFLPWVRLGISFGTSNYVDFGKKSSLFEAFALSEKKNIYEVRLDYINQEAATVLYSPNLVDYFSYTRRFLLKTDLYRFSGFYQIPSGFKFAGKYTYLDITDGNKGSLLELRLGKYFDPALFVGYEYYLTIFSRRSVLYFSPKSYDSHSIFADWTIYGDDEVEFKIGGKLGFIPESEYFLRELTGAIDWSPLENLTIRFRGTASNTVRDIVGYGAQSGYITAFWTIF